MNRQAQKEVSGVKTFLESWLSQAEQVFTRELSATLTPAQQLPLAAGSISLTVTLSGACTGSFAVLADRAALHSLLIAANVAEEGAEASWEFEMLQGLFDQIAHAAASALGEVEAMPFTVSTWGLGIPVVAYQLTLGRATMLMAFADQTYRATAASATQSANWPEAPTERPAGGQHPVPEAGKSSRGVELLMDVELEASLRFGSREMSLNEVLDLGPGDVVELDRHIAEPVDLLVGDKIVARGEVVLVNGNFGFSVVEVAEAEMRLESVRCLF
ncbi:flagellar motor switch protein FliN/FliY [Silvibacterium bohemicum]|uniref:Flagellar motor switch protein FliN n=1 Tax=Silvibacterium bohemicum TaxID=1577686 RepID=A0A841K3U5_9BACT|nr:FliM/FliN family flagellar motor switch protein [Silvibacterium bohemicum]MBB6147237.1 flagellar motor switch protein FliN/FliY [Silvibacterium bohemicum]